MTFLAGADDCNDNGISDECDIAGGTSPDCDDNRIPDECEIVCDDGNACTDDFCVGGACQHTNNSDPCDDDANPCTDDYCEYGVCQHTNNSDPCADNLFCNGTDTCSAGSCDFIHSGDPCLPQEQVCCENSDTCEECCEDAFCDDGDQCTGIDTCVLGECVATLTADCNGNGREDSCEIDEGTSGDCDENGVPDKCEPWFPDRPEAQMGPDLQGDPVLSTKNRYISIKTGGTLGRSQAIRVKCVSLPPAFRCLEPHGVLCG